MGDYNEAAERGNQPDNNPPKEAAQRSGTPPDWGDQMLCGQTDPDLFFAADLDGPLRGAAGISRAKKAAEICRVCPVLADCQPYALTEHEREPWATGTTVGGVYFNSRHQAVVLVPVEPAETGPSTSPSTSPSPQPSSTPSSDREDQAADRSIEGVAA